MAKKFLVLVVLAVVITGGAFAQVVVSAGIGYEDDTVKGGGSHVSETSYRFLTSGGYRIPKSKIGFGLDLSYSRDVVEATGSDDVAWYDLQVGGYFEYALLNTKNFAFWGKCGLGYLGGGSDDVTVTGFYTYIDPVLEYKMFKHASIYASTTVFGFAYRVMKPDEGSGKETKTILVIPLLASKSIPDIELGVKFLF